jgi:hypothetical protein
VRPRPLCRWSDPGVIRRCQRPKPWAPSPQSLEPARASPAVARLNRANCDVREHGHGLLCPPQHRRRRLRRSEPRLIARRYGSTFDLAARRRRLGAVDIQGAGARYGVIVPASRGSTHPMSTNTATSLSRLTSTTTGTVAPPRSWNEPLQAPSRSSGAARRAQYAADGFARSWLGLRIVAPQSGTAHAHSCAPDLRTQIRRLRASGGRH